MLIELNAQCNPFDHSGHSFKMEFLIDTQFSQYAILFVHNFY